MRQSWNEETLTKAATGCTTKGELRKKYPGARSAAKKLGIWKKITAHMPKTAVIGKKSHNRKWHSIMDILPFSSQCKTRTEFYNRFPKAYQGAKDLKILDEACAHMPKDASVGKVPHNKKWTRKTIPPEALKYDNRTDFHEKSPGAYNSAVILKILDEVCSHMGESTNKRKTIEEVRTLFESNDYTLLSTDYINNNTKLQVRCPEGHVYPATFGKFQDGQRCPICSLGNSSKMELELLEILKKHFPELTKDKFKVVVPNKPYIKAFEVDIFNPKTKLGIEFDGEHWHSFERMRNDPKKNKWSNKDISNYHKIKDTALMDCHGISIIHIKEEDWIADKQVCIDRCLEFLGISSERAA